MEWPDESEDMSADRAASIIVAWMALAILTIWIAFGLICRREVFADDSPKPQNTETKHDVR